MNTSLRTRICPYLRRWACLGCSTYRPGTPARLRRRPPCIYSHLRAAGLDPRVRLKVENLVLVAADIDMEVEMQRVAGEAMGAAFGNVTTYTNARDGALAAATSLFSSRQRLGTLVMEDFTEPQRAMMQRLANVDLIVYEGSGGGFFSHSYYQDPAVSSDVLALLRFGWRPGEGTRKGLQRVDENMNIWRIGPSYLATGTQ